MQNNAKYKNKKNAECKTGELQMYCYKSTLFAVHWVFSLGTGDANELVL